jgi:hypothetical protein
MLYTVLEENPFDVCNYKPGISTDFTKKEPKAMNISEGAFNKAFAQ